MSDVSVRFVHLLSGEFTSLQGGVEALELKCSAETVCVSVQGFSSAGSL